jgi:hypothetical protein
LQVHVACGGEGNGGWCVDADVITLDNFVHGHEPIEQVIAFL